MAAIVDHASLAAAVQSHCVGHLISDTEAAQFIAMAEHALNRVLRTQQQQTRVTATLVGGSATLPADFLSPVNITLSASPQRPLLAVGSDAADRLRIERLGMAPEHYTIEGNALSVVPTPGAAGVGIDMLYHARIPALAAGPNWLVANHADLYLAASLVQACMYVLDAERAALWDAAAQRCIAELNTDSDKRAWGGSPLVMRRARRGYC